METSEYHTIKSAYKHYIKQFSLSKQRLVFESNLQLKYEHTERVCDLIHLFSASLKLTEGQKNLALGIGLLHDIGRFYQLNCHRTYVDHGGLDHAMSGCRIIQDKNMIAHLPEHEQDIILSSVRYHNVKELPSGFPSHIRPFAELLRDADKIDIVKIAIDYYSGIRDQKDAGLIDIICEVTLEETCSPKIIQDVLKHKVVSITDIHTIYDEMLMYVSWLDKLNFECSRKRYVEDDYLPFIVSILPEAVLKTGIGGYIHYLSNKYHIKYSFQL